MQRSSTKNVLVADASHVLHETVSTLSNPERGAAIFAPGHTSGRVAS